MARRRTFKEPMDTAAAEDWHWLRAPVKVRGARGGTLTLRDDRFWGPCSSRTCVSAVVVGGKTYKLQCPVILRANVQYVVDVNGNVASFWPDISLNANWNEPSELDKKQRKSL